MTFQYDTPQIVKDTHNYSLSDCGLKIPQNIKLTLENNVLTLKSGSIIVWCGDTYRTTTTTADNTWTPNSLDYNKTGLIFSARLNGGIQGVYAFSKILSGTTAQRPAWSSSLNGSVYYDVDTKLFNYAGSSSWSDDWAVAYPICAVEIDNQGNVSFLKDSNGNDMIFNGTGFIGHHEFIYPQISGLCANNFDEFGRPESKKFTTNSLQIVELDTSSDGVGYVLIDDEGNALDAGQNRGSFDSVNNVYNNTAITDDNKYTILNTYNITSSALLSITPVRSVQVAQKKHLYPDLNSGVDLTNYFVPSDAPLSYTIPADGWIIGVIVTGRSKYITMYLDGAEIATATGSTSERPMCVCVPVRQGQTLTTDDYLNTYSSHPFSIKFYPNSVF